MRRAARPLLAQLMRPPVPKLNACLCGRERLARRVFAPTARRNFQQSGALSRVRVARRFIVYAAGMVIAVCIK
ncbi:MAG: hypothetical protein DMF64_04965 [Acidobacteria bacterium]|nr:MAG: hypothetical protein DMF64_04965 [Acidobacteriota bacterium]